MSFCSFVPPQFQRNNPWNPVMTGQVCLIVECSIYESCGLNNILFFPQSDVDNDLVGDSCDTNQDRYGISSCREADIKIQRVLILRAFYWYQVLGFSRWVGFLVGKKRSLVWITLHVWQCCVRVMVLGWAVRHPSKQVIVGEAVKHHFFLSIMFYRTLDETARRKFRLLLLQLANYSLVM